jgi:hypothetical protein
VGADPGQRLFLRELVRHGLDRGLLAQHGGIWRWRGELEAGTRLAELVGVRIEDVGESERPVLELVAVGAPLEVGLLEPRELGALDTLERSELVQRRADGRRRVKGGGPEIRHRAEHVVAGTADETRRE